MLAGNGKMRGHAFFAAHEIEVQTVARRAQIFRMRSAGRPGQNNARLGPRGQRGREFVRLGKNQDRIRRKHLAEHALLLRDGFARTEELDMRHPDVGDDSDVRAREAGQRLDFAGVVHADFPDANLVGGFGRENGQRQTDVVVEVSLRLVDGELCRHNRGGEIFRAGFAIAAGQADDTGLETVAIPRGEALQRGERVGNLNQRESVWRAGHILCDDRANGTGLRGGGDKLVPVKILALQSPVEVARLERPGVLADVRNLHGSVAAEQDSAASCGQGMKRRRVHDQAALPRMADSASATSSNGTLRSANSW